MISNSVTHLRSYTNTTIADITGNSEPVPCRPPMLPRRAASADVSTSSADIVASNLECFMMFHNVLSVFHDVLLVVHDVSQCFKSVS